MFRRSLATFVRRLGPACFAVAILLPALRCEAATQATRLGIYNNTSMALTTTVSVADSSDWEQNRPDRNFSPGKIAALSGSIQPEDLSSNSRSASFDMTVTFANGDVVTFRTDQKNAWKLSQYEARKLTLGGPQAADYTASWVVLPQETLAISISTRQDLSSWMAPVPDSLLISQMTIPGTHDSASLFDGPSFGFAKTQDLGLDDQLKLGVRFFDIRLNENLDVFHGPIDQHLKFSDVIDICTSFLQNNPSETILMSINASNIGKNIKNPDPFAQAVYNATNAGTGPWAVGEQIPTLGAVRGKILLLRRYPVKSAPAIGIDVSDWPDDTRYDLRTNSDGVTYSIQDHWKCCGTSAGKTDKRNEIGLQIDRARKTSRIGSAILFFNFTSANRVPVIGPRGNAQYFNPYLLGHLVQSPQRVRNGVLALDFVEWEQTRIPADSNDPEALVQQIVSYNLSPDAQ